jgi:hypothetical protein
MKFNLSKIDFSLLKVPDLDLEEFNNVIEKYLGKESAEFLKKGGKIYIKKKNRGKFTESAKRAGQSVQEHARSVLNDPNATPLQRKRANFARNVAKWKHKGRKKK